jgi:hypothetical protein
VGPAATRRAGGLAGFMDAALDAQGAPVGLITSCWGAAEVSNAAPIKMNVLNMCVQIYSAPAAGAAQNDLPGEAQRHEEHWLREAVPMELASLALDASCWLSTSWSSRVNGRDAYQQHKSGGMKTTWHMR